MRITSRLFKGTADDVVNASKMVWFPPLQESSIIVGDLAEMARRRKKLRYAFFDMQTYLANTMRSELLSLQHWREEAKEGNTTEERRLMEQFTRMTLNALEQVANGIAYRFFDYNHTLVQSLWRQQSSPFNILSDGFLNSTDVAAVLNDLPVHDRQVLLSDLNALTNIGDLVIKDATDFEIVEVKTSKKASGQKVSRQKAKMRELVDFLTGGRKQIDGMEIEMLNVPARKHSLSTLGEVLDKSDREGIAVAHLNVCISAGAICLDHVEKEQVKAKMDETLNRVVNGRDRNGLWIIPSTYLREKAGIIAPLTIYPIPSKQVVDILFGNKIVFFCLSLDAVETKLAQAGWNVARSKNAFGTGEDARAILAKEAPEDFNIFTLWKGEKIERNLGVPIDFLFSCAVEMVDVQSYIEVLRALWEKGKDGVKRHWICFYEDESHLWH
jgi:hypothetical protein